MFGKGKRVRWVRINKDENYKDRKESILINQKLKGGKCL